MRVCAEPGCPTISAGRRCPDHTRQLDRARGTTKQRGYGHEHVKTRAAWQHELDTMSVDCWRCGHQLDPDPAAWQLGHCDDNRTIYHGPEHTACNLATVGRGSCPHHSHT